MQLCAPSLLISFLQKRVAGIEPALLAWKARVLPLNYTRYRLVAYFNYSTAVDFMQKIHMLLVTQVLQVQPLKILLDLRLVFQYLTAAMADLPELKVSAYYLLFLNIFLALELGLL